MCADPSIGTTTQTSADCTTAGSDAVSPLWWILLLILGLSPFEAPTACLVAGCPGVAVDRGRCELHRRTTSQRGYGTPHQRERAAALPGASCEAADAIGRKCGCTVDLQRDHVIPSSLAADSRRRWLCNCPQHRHHARLGLKSTSVRGRP